MTPELKALLDRTEHHASWDDVMRLRELIVELEKVADAARHVIGGHGAEMVGEWAGTCELCCLADALKALNR